MNFGSAIQRYGLTPFADPKLVFTFDIGEDGVVQGCLATPYDGRLEPDPKEYAWE